jgi:hypothetical protein
LHWEGHRVYSRRHLDVAPSRTDWQMRFQSVMRDRASCRPLRPRATVVGKWSSFFKIWAIRLSNWQSRFYSCGFFSTSRAVSGLPGLKLQTNLRKKIRSMVFVFGCMEWEGLGGPGRGADFPLDAIQTRRHLNRKWVWRSLENDFKTSNRPSFGNRTTYSDCR